MRTHCCDVSWAAQTGKHLLRTQNVSEQNQKHFLCPGHKICVRNKIMLRARANGETFVSATMCHATHQQIRFFQGSFSLTWTLTLCNISR